MDFPLSGRRALLGLLLLAIALGSGCVRRRMTIRTNPPGALVFIDKQEIGMTPVSVSFLRYGTREIQLMKDGHETLTVKQKFNPPWYQAVPLDFFSENLWPGELRDERVLDFQLVPQRNVPNQELRGRGEQLRQRTQQGVLVAPFSPTAVPGVQPQGGVDPRFSTPSGPLRSPAGPPPLNGLPSGGQAIPDYQQAPPELMQQFVPVQPGQ